MTLILSRSSHRFVLQLSDRLVTQGSAAFDPISNKTVLFFALGGMASLSYTGIAFIGDLPTDQWIAQQLTGFDLTRFEKPPAMASRGPPSKIDFGMSLYNLAGQLQVLENHVSERDWLSSWDTRPFEIAINGWQWNSRGSTRPIIAWIEKPAGTRAATLGYADRNWYAGRTVSIVATPSGYIDGATIDRIGTDLRGSDADASERVLTDAMRAVARASPHVGSDIMSVLLGPPYTGYARVKFISTEGHSLELYGGKHRSTMPAAFTPWIAGPSSLHAPSLISRSYEVALGPYIVQVTGPAAHARLGVVSGLVRRKRPRKRH